MGGTEPAAAQFEPGDAYRAVRERIGDLLGPAGPDIAERRVPACPEWTVRETVSHLVGACSDILAGKADPAGSDEWTAAQVAARQGQPIAAMLSEWASTGDQVAAALAGRSALGQVVMDAVSHEYDLREALDVAAPEDDPVLAVAVGWLTRWFGRHLDATGAPPLLLVADGQPHPLGSGDPASTLRTSQLQALRLLTGRIPLADAARLDWDGDPTPWLPALTWGPFRPA